MATYLKPCISRHTAYQATPRYSSINRFAGRIAVISIGEVDVELVVLLSNQQTVVATIGLSAFESMDLKLNSAVTLLLRENAILLSNDDCSPILSTRNSLVGEVCSIRRGAVNTEISLRLSGCADLVVSVGSDELEPIECRLGDRLWANFKASEVILVSENTY